MVWAPSYVTTAELKSYLRIPAADVVDDAELSFAIVAASRAVDQSTNRQFGNVGAAETRVFTARHDRHMRRHLVDVDDIHTKTGLLVDQDDDDTGVYDDGSWTVDAEDGFFLAPVNAGEVSRPWTQIVFRSDADTPTMRRNGIQVTADFGWATVPDTVKQATLLQASRFFARRNAPFGVSGSPEMGSEVRLLSQVDPDVAVVLRPYRRVWGAA